MARSEVASDTFDTEISTSWTVGEGDTDGYSWATGGYAQPSGAGSALNKARRNTGTYSNNQYSSVDVNRLISTSGGGAGIGACVRAQASASDESMYTGYMINGAYGERYNISEYNSSFGSTDLATDGVGTTLGAGVIITIEVDGTNISMYTVEGGADTLRLGPVSDATVASGWPGLVGWGDNSAADSRTTAWAGGDIVAAGGTIYGRSPLRSPIFQSRAIR